VSVQPPAPPDVKTRRRWLEKQLARRRADVARPSLRVDRVARESGLEGIDPLSAAAIAWHFPRRTTGLVDPKAVVCLTPATGEDHRPGMRADWLVARAPEGATDPLLLEVAIENVIPENQDHRWTGTPWRWETPESPPSAAERWGADPLTIAPILDALDGHRWDEALERAGARMEPGLRGLLDGQDIDRDTRDLTAAWSVRMAEMIRGMALWRLADATSLLRKARPMRLFGLGGVNVQRKPGVFLGLESGRPRLGLEWNATNERVPLVAWERPIDLDLLRAGLISPDDLPG
jgi:hypothetical protein